MIDKLDLNTMNITEEKKAKLKQLFPEVFSEDKIDFDKLRLTLGEDVDTNEERFGLNWSGKTDCFKIIQEPSIATLKPCKEESVDWDTTENLFIEGDNLEVLKQLQKAYYNKVKMIYIDPPYNTGNEFIYPDKYQENLDTYLAYSGQLNDEGKKFSTNTETQGRFHSNWLNMMYPRLFLARNLLKEDGLICIHIDKNEVHHLQLLCNEIFGEENIIGNVIWNKLNPKGDSKGIAYQHENILFYSKNKESFFDSTEFKRSKKNAQKIIDKAYKLFTVFSLEEANSHFSTWIKKQDFSGGEKAYSKIDKNGDVYRGVSMAWPNKKMAPDEYFIPLIHPDTEKECPVPERGWRNPKKTMEQLIKDNLILFGDNEKKQPERKYLLKENMYENIPSIFEFGGSDDDYFKSIKLNFENPKPHQFVEDILAPLTANDDIILDFFSGSCTTAHSIMELNYKDKGKRRFIMIQLPEPCIKNNYFEYNTIADIGKERIRSVIKKIKENQIYTNKEISQFDIMDLGFKVFKLDKSNFQLWNGDTKNKELPTILEKALLHIDIKSSQEDILNEILLKSGFQLTVQIENITLDSKKVFSIEEDALLICLEDNISKKLIEEMAKLNPIRVICLDSAFNNNDQLKTNAIQIMKSHNIESFKTV